MASIRKHNDAYAYGFSDPTKAYVVHAKKGLDSSLIETLSVQKAEPEWMKTVRLRAYQLFCESKLPSWLHGTQDLDFSDISYYLKPVTHQAKTWDDVPESIRTTFEKIGVPQEERAHLAGLTAQYESEKVYGKLRDVWAKKGVVFLSMDEGLRQYPELVRQYFGTLVPADDNIFASLNTACWSGGSFVYVPKGVHVDMPLQTYFRINAKNAGQFERTLIIADEGSQVTYTEGCSSPRYSTASLHAAVVEVFVKKHARVQYITVQNWYRDVYNLVTKRAHVEERGTMEWIDCNLGSKFTAKYPSFILAGEYARGEMVSLAVAGKGQYQDTGCRAIHLAPNTFSTIVSKSISKNGGRSSYRGTVHIGPHAHESKNRVVCDALILDEQSRSDTYPTQRVFTNNTTISHEATVSRIQEDQLVYMMSRGVPEREAQALLVRGFAQPLIKKLPFEFAVEMNRLLDLEMDGSVG